MELFVLLNFPSTRHLVSSPGIMLHAQQIGLALHECSALDKFVTTAVYREDSSIARILSFLKGPYARKLDTEFRRRAAPFVPQSSIRTFARWEVIRTAASLARLSPIFIDRLWDLSSHHFDAHVARRYVPKSAAVHCVEYTALGSFRAAERYGVAKILHLPSLDSRQSHQRSLLERREWPETATVYDAYFDSKFEERYARRQAEIAAADIIIVNSGLTATSHISAGADPSKVKVVPLAAPLPTLSQSLARPKDAPLRLVWAGNFSVGKGAHILMKAWRGIKCFPQATLTVVGSIAIPQTLLADLDGVEVRGAGARDQLLEELPTFDALIFPTLSDGFGMAVTEALSAGVPVITTKQAGAVDVLTPYRDSIVVPAGDVTALVQALMWCLDNRERLSSMRPAALEAAWRRQWSHFRADMRAAVLGTTQDCAGARKNGADNAKSYTCASAS
ncbi:glycosyltransferase family 4 protein [Nostoc sp. NIES-2111]